MSAATPKTTRSTYCHHCKEPTARRDLDEHLLCSHCQQLPDVTGDRDPTKRALASASPEQWGVLRDQVHVVGERVAPTSALPPGQTPSGRYTPQIGADGEVQLLAAWDGTLREWRQDVIATPTLTNEAKLLMLVLADAADYSGPTEGGNCFPSKATLATRLGWTKWRILKTLRLAQDTGWLRIHEVRVTTPRGGVQWSSHSYQLVWPDGRELSATDEKRYRRLQEEPHADHHPKARGSRSRGALGM